MNIFPFTACYEGEPVTEPTSAAPVTEPVVQLQNEPVLADTPLEPVGAFTQEDVNKFLAEDRRKHQEKYQTLKVEMEGLLENKAVQGDERERIATQLRDLQAQYRTKEQQLAAEKEEAELEYTERITNAEKEAVQWRDMYTNSTIETALQASAIRHEAWNPDQIIVQLRTYTKLIDELDSENRPTGRLIPMVEMVVRNKESGVTEPLQMTPDEAVEYLKKDEKSINLFKHSMREGIGSINGTGAELTGKNGLVDQSRISDDEYFNLRKKNPSALGIDPEGFR